MKIDENIIKYLKSMQKLIDKNKNVFNIDPRFNIFKQMYQYKKNMQMCVFPFIKSVMSISDFIIIDKNKVMFYTLEEDGIIDYEEIHEFVYL